MVAGEGKWKLVAGDGALHLQELPPFLCGALISSSRLDVGSVKHSTPLQYKIAHEHAPAGYAANAVCRTKSRMKRGEELDDEVRWASVEMRGVTRKMT